MCRPWSCSLQRFGLLGLLAVTPVVSLVAVLFLDARAARGWLTRFALVVLLVMIAWHRWSGVLLWPAYFILCDAGLRPVGLAGALGNKLGPLLAGRGHRSSGHRGRVSTAPRRCMGHLRGTSTRLRLAFPGVLRRGLIVRKAFARLVLRLTRWHTVGEVPSSGILVGAPHTSYWDWVAMLLMMWSGGVPPRVLIKAEVMRTPLGPLLRANGGIALDRRNPGAVVRQLLAEAKLGEPFLLVIAAEGTRKKGDYWKSGFYRIAQQTGLPISLGFVDGPTRTVGFGPTFRPSGDVVADMDMVRAFYADKRGINPLLRTEPRLREEDPAAERSV